MPTWALSSRYRVERDSAELRNRRGYRADHLIIAEIERSDVTDIEPALNSVGVLRPGQVVYELVGVYGASLMTRPLRVNVNRFVKQGARNVSRYVQSRHLRERRSDAEIHPVSGPPVAEFVRHMRIQDARNSKRERSGPRRLNGRASDISDVNLVSDYAQLIICAELSIESPLIVEVMIYPKGSKVATNRCRKVCGEPCRV